MTQDSKAQITVIGMGSPNVFKVALMLEETGLAYGFERCDVILGEHRSERFRALNPTGKVPVLLDHRVEGEPLALWESGAILIHLAESTGTLLAASGPARTAALQWLMFQMASVGPVFGQAIHLTSFAAQEVYAVNRFTKEFGRIARVLEQRLGTRPFLAGEDYSIADVATYPWILTARRFFPDALASPALQRWTDTIASRAAAARAAELGAELAALDRESFNAATPAQLDRYFGR